jgi:carbon storage regulator
MLVLSRQRDETIMIGDDIELTVVDIRGDKVRIGIKAPTHIAVHRKEVYDAIKRENEAAQRAGLREAELGSLRPQSGANRQTRRVIPPAAKLNERPKRESA